VGEHLSEKVGTPYTVAPEILKGSYNEKSDMWCKCYLRLSKVANLLLALICRIICSVSVGSHNIPVAVWGNAFRGSRWGRFADSET
jgi:serine/threonine protein kinase